MKRRRLLNLLTALSLLLCVVACVLWVRSYSWRSSTKWVYSRQDTPRLTAELIGVYFESGRIGIRRETFDGHGETDEAALAVYDAWRQETHFRGREELDLPIGSTPWNRVGFSVCQWGNTGELDRNSIWDALLHRPAKPLLYWTESQEVWRAPTWPLAASMGVPLAWAASRSRRRWRQRRNARVGLCTSCGYDLRATLEQCPECGKPVSVSNVA
jgi:hypothetical protein